MTPSSQFCPIRVVPLAKLAFGCWLLFLSGCTAESKTPPQAKSGAEQPGAEQPAALSPTGEQPAAPQQPAAAVETTGDVDSEDGVVIRYEVHGAGEPALVFIHGWCCERSFWQPQIEYFARSRQVVAIDLGGHGASGLGRKVWSMAAFGKDVAAVIDKLQLKSVILVGHSMGGPVMLEAAPLLGDRLVGLVGVDTLTDPEEQYTPEQIATYLEPFEQDFAKAMREALQHEQDFFTAKTNPALIEQIVAKMTAAPPQVGVSAFQAMLDFANESQRPRLTAVQVPLVCINARPDPLKVAAGQKYAPQLEVVSLPDSGHFLMMEYPEAFNALLDQHLAKMTQAANKGK